MSEELLIITGERVLITYVWHVIPSIQNINLVFKAIVHESLAQNIKHTLLEYIPAVCMTTMFHVQCVMWPNVLHKLWYQVVTCAPRDGHASTKDTLWRGNTITIVRCILAWMKLLITREEPTLIVTVLFSFLLKEIVVHFPASLISQGVSWHAQFALVKYELIFVFSNYWTPIIVTFILIWSFI
jgi:hypothetical protein